MDKQGQFIQTFGEGKLQGASGLHIADKYVYVCDWNSDCIVVYETSGEFVTSFGRPGQNKGEFCGPCSITFCVNGCMYVCDYWMKRVQSPLCNFLFHVSFSQFQETLNYQFDV